MLVLEGIMNTRFYRSGSFLAIPAFAPDQSGLFRGFTVVTESVPAPESQPPVTKLRATPPNMSTLKQASLSGFFSAPKPPSQAAPTSGENFSPQDEPVQKPALSVPAASKSPGGKSKEPTAAKPAAASASAISPKKKGPKKQSSPATKKTAKDKGPAKALGKTPKLPKSPKDLAKKSPKKAVAPKVAAPKAAAPALPEPLPVLATLPAAAKPALLVSMQMLRIFAHKLELEEGSWSFEQLCADLSGEASAASAAGGVLSELHVALLRALLTEEEPLLKTREPFFETHLSPHDDDTPEASRWRAVADGAPRAPGLAIDYSATHNPKLKDAEALLDHLTWPEVLRQLIVQWCEPCEYEKRQRGPQMFDDDLIRCAAGLREAEYAQLPVELKARALQALCERALNVFHADIDESGEELGQVAAQSKAETKETEKAARAEESKAKEVAKAKSADLKAKCSEAWKVLEEKDAAQKLCAEALSKAVLSQKGVDAAKAASSKAKTALELARTTYQQTKARRDSGGGDAAAEARVAAAAAAVVADISAGTSRQREVKAAQEEEKAARVKEKQLAKRQEASQRAVQLEETLRIKLLGKDRNGARYWALPQMSAASAEATEAPTLTESRLYVESDRGVDSDWGEVADLEALKKALRASHAKPDLELLKALRGLPPVARPSTVLRPAAAAAAAASAEREADSSDDEEGAAIAAHQAAALEAEAEAAVDASGVQRAGHEWLGQRVRQLSDEAVADGTVTGWRPAKERAAGDDVEAMEEEEEGEASAGPAEHEAAWLVTMDSGKTAMLGAAEVKAALAEARDAPLRRLVRLMLQAETAGRDEAFTHWQPASEEPWSPEGLMLMEADAVPAPAADAPQLREAWVQSVTEVAADAAGLRGALLQLAKAAPPAADAAAAQWRREWEARLHASATVPQLAVRLLELESMLLPRDGLRTGMQIEVSIEDDDGSNHEWVPAPIVGVWRDGSFRALVKKQEKDGPLEWVEDYASPYSKQGRKERGKDWRWVGPAASTRAKRGAIEPSDVSLSNIESRGGKRAAAKRARSSRSFVESQKSDDDEEGSASGRSSRRSSGASEAEVRPSYEVAPPEMGQQVEVLKNKRKWVAAEVSRVLRGGSFEAQEHADDGDEGAKGKHTVDDYMTTWRNLGDAKGGRRR